MLQRAASNAYSWWWASHVRTKQSKWLEQNLMDMEDRVNDMLKIIDQDGDSFAKRAEMYYKKRPELMEFVEESFRAYRSMAERFDHLSRELQNANRTIAAVYPEQIQFDLEEYEDEDCDESSNSKKLALTPDQSKSQAAAPPVPPMLNIPKTPSKSLKPPPMFIPKKDQFKRTTSFTRTIMGSGLSKNEALEEIDSIQKEVLILQTEREFMKSSYENAMSKFLELENQINGMQERVYSLQDEFGIGTIIEDDEARKLMATTALKSCQQTIEHLQEEQEKSSEEANEEGRKIDEARNRLESIKEKHFKYQPTRPNSNSDDNPASTAMYSRPDDERATNDLEALHHKIKVLQEGYDTKSLTMSELASRIDDIVDTVISLESAVASQAALVSRLRMETSELLAHIRNLEEDKEGWSDNSEELRNRIKELEDELQRVNKLNHKIDDHNSNLQTHLVEASSDVAHLSEKLSNIKSGEEAAADEESVSQDIIEVCCGSEMAETDTYTSKGEAESIDSIPESRNKPEISTVGSGREFENVGVDIDSATSTGLNEKEKFLLREYASVLKSLKEVTEQLAEVEKKNQVGLFEQAVQIREMMHMKDEEIQALRQKFGIMNNEVDTPVQQMRMSTAETAQSEIDLDGSPQYSEISSLSCDRKTVYDLLYGQNVEPVENTTEAIARRKVAFSLNGLRMLLRGDQQDMAIINEKFRSVLDHLLEENMDFWLRFSTAFQKIHEFQSTTQDLKGEISKLREAKKQAGQDPLKSDAKPIYKHLKEIQTELKVWLERNALLKVEIQSRYSTLCNIHEEVKQLGHMGCRPDAAIIENQVVKFQGEIINMKRETNKVASELQSGLNRVKSLQIDIDIALLRMDEEFGVRVGHPKKEPPSSTDNSSKPSRPRVPLRSFLFGVKLKKHRKLKPPSIF